MDETIKNGIANQEEEYLSHPIEEPRHSLIQHSIQVARKTRELLSDSRFRNPELGYLAGLLHDIGKLNPYYQILFRTDKRDREAKQSKLIQKYAPIHSPYSSWIADKLLKKMDKRIDYDILDKIIMLIYGHHSRIHRSIANVENSERFKTSQREMLENLKRFYQLALQRPEFSSLSWNRCLSSFLDPMSFEIQLNPMSEKQSVNDFLEISFAYSCLLQADRGSFSDWKRSDFKIEVKTSKLMNTKSRLANIRNVIQKELLSDFEYDEPVVIVNAPTGSGKTKVFLDLINNYKSKHKGLQGIFYFSPLLALTEDFEKKLRDTINDLDSVLIYNHLFSGSIEEKRMISDGDQVYESKWIFENESFNRPFIVTTTQRLLYTIFSNNHGDKLKLASLRNSVLIIDEIQTIPKYILGILVTNYDIGDNLISW